MSEEKDIRFSEKKVDESWKDNTSREKSSVAGSPSEKQGAGKSPNSTATPQTSKTFIQLLTSLGFQAMMHLGEVPNPETRTRETNFEAAREVIDILMMLKEKTNGNLSPDEEQMLNTLLPELQMKFSEKI